MYDDAINFPSLVLDQVLELLIFRQHIMRGDAIVIYSLISAWPS